MKLRLPDLERVRIPERRRVVGAAIVVAAVVVVIVAMFLAEGYRATTLDLTDYGVWVTKQDGGAMAGRINARIATQDAAISYENPIDVAQDGPDIYVVDPAGSVGKVDPANLEHPPGESGAIPEG